MGIGHVALALGASKAEPRLNVGWLVFAAVLSDFLLGIFAAFGLEHATVPADFTSRHYLLFTFPYSHGLLALIIWSIIFGFLVSRLLGLRGRRVWILVALVALSHFRSTDSCMWLDSRSWARTLPSSDSAFGTTCVSSYRWRR